MAMYPKVPKDMMRNIRPPARRSLFLNPSNQDRSRLKSKDASDRIDRAFALPLVLVLLTRPGGAFFFRVTGPPGFFPGLFFLFSGHAEHQHAGGLQPQLDRPYEVPGFGRITGVHVLAVSYELHHAAFGIPEYAFGDPAAFYLGRHYHLFPDQPADVSARDIIHQTETGIRDFAGRPDDRLAGFIIM